MSVSNSEYKEYSFFIHEADEYENPDAWFSEDLQKPYVGHLISRTIDFRNGPETYEMGCLEKFGRRVIVGELFFALLAVAALVENAVRIAFSLLAMLPSLCCEEGVYDKIMETMLLAVMTTPDLMTRALIGFATSPFFGDNMTMEHLGLCGQDVKSM